jgi:aldehyde dehydrogenase
LRGGTGSVLCNFNEEAMAARRKIEEIVKALAEKNAEAWGKIEFEETKIGRLDTR